MPMDLVGVSKDLGMVPTDLGMVTKDLGGMPMDLGVAPMELGVVPTDLGGMPAMTLLFWFLDILFNLQNSHWKKGRKLAERMFSF